MSRKIVLNDSVGSTEILVVSGVGVFLGAEELRARMVFRSVEKKFETVDLTSKVGEQLVRSDSSAVGSGTRALSVVDMVFFFNLMAD